MYSSSLITSGVLSQAYQFDCSMGVSKNQTLYSRYSFTKAKWREIITLLDHLVMLLLIHCYNAVLLTHDQVVVHWNHQVFFCRAVSYLVDLQFVLMQLLFAFSFFPLLCLTCMFTHFTYPFSAVVLSNCISE